MSHVKRWFVYGVPEPEDIWPLPGAPRELPRTTPEEQASMARQFFEKLDASLLPRGESTDAEVAAASPLAGVDEVEGEHSAGDYGATVRSPTFDERALAAPPPEPVAPEPIAPSPPVLAQESILAKNAALEALKITSLDLPVPDELRRLGRLPFKPPSAVNELSRTKKMPVFDPKKGETVPSGDDTLTKAIASLPFDRASVGDSIVLFPRLSIERYVSLRAELALWPERSGEILRQYHVVNEAARRALLEHWEAKLAASPEARATFETDLASCTARMRAQRA